MRTGRFLRARRQLHRIQYAEGREVKAMPASCIHHKAHPGAVRLAVRLRRWGTGVEINSSKKRRVRGLDYEVVLRLLCWPPSTC